MRFVHTADWHLGRLFHNIHLTDDQRFTLRGLVTMADERNVDAVVVAGDVFDRAIPPTDAVDLLDEIVGVLALDLKIPVVMVAGNHDSPARLEFFSGLARRAGVHVVGRVGARPQPVEVAAADGTCVRFWPLAYTDPETARFELGRDDIHSFEDVFRAQLDSIRPALGGGARDVLVAHSFVSGCRESDSERPLTVGGAGAVAASLFEGFDYVALGHLHERQAAGAGSVRYAGSLLKYSFDEEAHHKSVSMVELGPTSPAKVEEVRLPIRRDVRRVRGSFADIVSGRWGREFVDAYIEVVLTDSEPVLSPLDRLRSLFPYILSIRRETAEVSVSGPEATSAGLKTRSVMDLFSEFFQDVKGVPLSETQTAELVAVIDQTERAGREAVST